MRKLLHCICINYEMKYQILRNMGVWTISVSYSRLLCAHFYQLFSLRHKISISFLKSPAVYSCVWLTDNHEILSWLKQLTAMNSVVHTKFYLIIEAKNLILTNFVHFVNLNYFWNLKTSCHTTVVHGFVPTPSSDTNFFSAYFCVSITLT